MKHVVLTGNPNSGKTTVFNELTGLRAKVGNYAGVTVERKEGMMRHADDVTIIDLPGTYSLSPRSIDEEIARDVLLNRLSGEVPKPDIVVIVADASNLERNLFYATQVIELGHRVVLALNMADVARDLGQKIDTTALEKELGVPVVSLIANMGEGMDGLRDLITETLHGKWKAAASIFPNLPDKFQVELDKLAKRLTGNEISPEAEALLLLTDRKYLAGNEERYPEDLPQQIESARGRLNDANIKWRSIAIETRYAKLSEICKTVVEVEKTPVESSSDKLDRVLTHKLWGMLIFVAIMAVIFQVMFTLSSYPMDLIDGAVSWFAGSVKNAMLEGALRDLLVNGIIGGVGAVVIFLPQICLLFLFIALLEGSGYMARAAFLMDRLMSQVGLHGKSFVPMLSSFACAIPGIMATRTIENPKDRLVTILVAPLMSCSARLPVYALLIGACVPLWPVLGPFDSHGLLLLGMYLLGVIVALLMAFIFKKTLLKGETPMLIMELPPYRRPQAKVVLRHVWDRAKLFVTRAGTVILGVMILLWFLQAYPHNQEITNRYDAERSAAVTNSFPEIKLQSEIDKKLSELKILFSNDSGDNATSTELNSWKRINELNNREAGEHLRHSFAGKLGRFIEPAISPLGYDWKMGIGIVASFAAREVYVGTMAVVYNAGETDDDLTLEVMVQQQSHPDRLLLAFKNGTEQRTVDAFEELHKLKL